MTLEEALAEIATLKKAIEKITTNKDEILGKLKKTEKEARKAQDEKDRIEREAEDKRLADEGLHEERVELAVSPFRTQVTDLQTKLDEATARADESDKLLRSELIGNGVSAQLLEAGVTDPNLLQAATLMIMPSADLAKDGENVSVTIAGKPIDDFMKEWARGVGKSFITSPNSGGGDHGVGGAGGGSEFEQYFTGDTRNLTKQIELKRTNPEAYDELSKKYPAY